VYVCRRATSASNERERRRKEIKAKKEKKKKIGWLIEGMGTRIFLIG
jgi:hypothetical protein